MHPRVSDVGVQGCNQPHGTSPSGTVHVSGIVLECYKAEVFALFSKQNSLFSLVFCAGQDRWRSVPFTPTTTQTFSHTFTLCFIPGPQPELDISLQMHTSGEPVATGKCHLLLGGQREIPRDLELRGPRVGNVRIKLRSLRVVLDRLHHPLKEDVLTQRLLGQWQASESATSSGTGGLQMYLQHQRALAGADAIAKKEMTQVHSGRGAEARAGAGAEAKAAASFGDNTGTLAPIWTRVQAARLS